jgi:hypothetical protein
VTWSDGFVDRTTAVLGKGAHTLTTTRGWTFDVTVRRALLDLALPTCDLGTATGPQRWSA